jgi:hypothetical protein
MKKGLLFQAAVLGLTMGTYAYASDDHKGHSHAKAETEEVTGKCMGANSCKGKTDCGGKDHSCHALNTCKGKGWIKLSEAKCKEHKGATWEKDK